MKSHSFRFLICLGISSILHLAILFWLLQPDELKVKAGSSTDRLAKIPGFKVAGGEILKSGKELPQDEIENILQQQKVKPRPKETQTQSIKPKKNVAINQKLQYDTPTKNEHTPSKQTAELLAQTSTIEVGNANKSTPHEFQGVDQKTIRDINELYGEEFGDLGMEEKEFITNNLRHIGRITQSYLRYPSNAGRIGQEGVNAVEFYLHPNGDISELKLIHSTGFKLLDRNSEKTIQIAYKDYPHPRIKTLIRIKVTYHLY